MAVSFANNITAGNGTPTNYQFRATGSWTSIVTTGLTITAGATLLVATLVIQNSSSVTPTALAATWNGVAMTLRSNTTTTSGTIRETVAIFTLVNPTSGNQTLSVTWTGTETGAYLGAAAFNGTDTTTGVNAANNITANTGTSLAVTSTTDGATVAMFATNGSTPTMNQTAIWSASNAPPGGGASYALGGTSNSHTFTGAGGSVPALAGINIIAGAGAAANSPHLNTFLQAVNRAGFF